MRPSSARPSSPRVSSPRRFLPLLLLLIPILLSLAPESKAGKYDVPISEFVTIHRISCPGGPIMEPGTVCGKPNNVELRFKKGYRFQVRSLKVIVRSKTYRGSFLTKRGVEFTSAKDGALATLQGTFKQSARYRLTVKVEGYPPGGKKPLRMVQTLKGQVGVAGGTPDCTPILNVNKGQYECA